MKKFLFIIALITLLVPETKATHIVGGELNYLYLGNDDYEIRLTVYRDCFNGVPPFDDPASIGIFNANNVLVQNVLINFTGLDTLPSVINSPCVTPPTNVCYEVTTYIDTVNLPPISGGYQLAYQRCCRNITILNIVLPNSTGATYFASIPDTNVVDTNSNPVFNALPPSFLCSQVPFTFDHSATDPDGDSLVYELFQPFEGASTTAPQPQPPNAPPYGNVVWNPPFSTTDMLGGIAPLSIDPNTGILTATPGPLGQFVIGIKVSEYRDGVFLSETKRDFQFNIVPCGNITVAALQAPNFSCESFTASFANNSVGAGSFLWDFGDPTTTNDTSSAFTPTYTYPDTGTYIVTLIAFSDINPLCNDTSLGEVIILPEFEINTTFFNDPCSQDAVFTSNTSLDSVSSVIYNWDFGDPSISGDVSNLMNPSYTYSDSGTYNVRLIAFSPINAGCNDTIVFPVTVDLEFTLEADFVDNPCSGDVLFSGSSSYDSFSNIDYSWNFGDLTLLNDTSNVSNPSYIYQNTGNFNPVLIAQTSNPNCSDTVPLSLTILPEFVLSTDFSNRPCTQEVVFNTNSTLDNLAPVNFIWDFGDPNTTNDVSNLTNPTYNYSNSGNYTVTVIGSSPNLIPGCSDTNTFTLTIFPNFELNSSFTNDPCSSTINFSGSTPYDSAGLVNYFWDFGDPTIPSDTSGSSNPTYSYPNPGTFNPVLIAAIDSPACADTIPLSLIILPDFEFDQNITEIRCTRDVRFSARSSLDRLTNVNYTWDFGDGEKSSSPSVQHTYNSGGTYPVRLLINTSNGCSDSLSIPFLKSELSEIFIPNAFTPNNDGENDILYVRGDFDRMLFSIYNRWGEKVFESTDQSIGWDGTYKGNLVEPGVFVFHLTTECGERAIYGGEDPIEGFVKGNVTVIR